MPASQLKPVPFSLASCQPLNCHFSHVNTHTLDEGHVIIVYRLLLGKDLFQAFNVVQSIYINC